MYLVITAQSCASEPTKTCIIARKKDQQLEKQKQYFFCLETECSTYKIPPAAGATLLNNDIRVTEMPFATPLCSCVCTCFIGEVRIYKNGQVYVLKQISLLDMIDAYHCYVLQNVARSSNCSLICSNKKILVRSFMDAYINEENSNSQKMCSPKVKLY